MKIKLLLLCSLLFCIFTVQAQDVSLYRQFNGRYDFTFVGNTLNPSENNLSNPCTIFTTSSAQLNLNAADEVEAAYLYWAGSGTGIHTIKLNGQEVTAQRQFPLIALTDATPRPYFSDVADVTALVQATGNGTYTVSDFDLNPVINAQPRIYCSNSTNFGGWVIVIIYKNNTLPLNQLNIYDGLQYVPDSVDITLSSLNVIDNIGAKIGFVAWEGDVNIANSETLSFNGNELTNAVNPPGNAFNGTNSITGATNLYNMDLDVYDIQGYINVGDESAEISLRSSQDFVMINVILTKLNSQLPDATVKVNNVVQQCNSEQIQLNYTVFNVNSTDILPAGTAVSVYIDDVFITHFTTTAPLPIDGSESGTITITLPPGTGNDFELKLIADDLNGTGNVKETDETNNVYIQNVQRLVLPPFTQIPELVSCNEGFGTGTFDFSHYAEELKTSATDIITFHESATDAQQGTNAITNTTDYTTQNNPHEIFVRREGQNSCFVTGSFLLRTRLCPPETYNYITPNGDGINDTFFVKGLRNIFLNFKMSIYNRWGSLVWVGDHSAPDWDGIATEDKAGSKNTSVPTGTYYFVLELNEPDYPEPIVGWVYVTK